MTTTSFVFEFQDNLIWDNYVLISSVNSSGNKQLGKCFNINSSNGSVQIPLGYGIPTNAGFHFVVENIIMAGVTYNCGTHYWFYN